MWFESDTGATYIYYDSVWVEIGNSGAVEVASLDDIGDVTITSVDDGDFLKWNGSAWVNDPINLGTDTTGNYMSDVSAGTGISISHTQGEGSTATVAIDATLDELSDVSAASPTEGQFLKWNGTAWVPDDIPTINTLDDVGDVTITSASAGEFLKWNGSAWVNDAIDLGTDTTGSYVQSLVAGTGITLTNNSGEGATPTVAVTANTFETYGAVSAHEADTTNIHGIADTSVLVTLAGTQTLTNKTLTSPTITGVSPAITLAGDLTGSVTLTNLGNGTLTATVAADSVALGTDTTGDYVQNLTAGTGITLSNNSGEGSSPTIAIGQSVATDANPSFAGATLDAVQIGITAAGEIDTTAGNLTIDSAGGTVTVDDNLTVTGNLTVSGTTTSVNTETLTIDDNIIVLNNNATGAPSENAGIEIERGSSTNVALRWNESTDAWQITSDGTTYDDIATAADIDEVAIDSLDDIGDVTITSAANGDALVWNGSAWVNDTIAGGATVSPSAPASPSEGDLWFDTESGLAFVRLSSAWVEIGGPGAGANVAVSSVAPASPSEGDLWFDSDVAATFVYYDSVWVEVGASGFAAVVSDSEPSDPNAGQLWFNSTDGGTYIYYDSVWMEIGAAPFNELLSTVNAKGDLLVGTANDTIDRLAVGSNTQLLSANSATATGLEWITPAYAPTASPTFTGTVTLPSATSIGTVTSTEIGYLDGVTSLIQTQLDTKASTGKAIAMAIVFGG
jgi:hypothetical protein